MSDNGTPYSIFLFNMTHAPAKTEDDGNQWKCPPDPQIPAEEHQVKDQVGDVNDPVLLVLLLECLRLKQPPEPLLKHGVNKQENQQSHPMPPNKVTDMNDMRQHHPSNLNEPNTIDSNQEIGADRQGKSLPSLHGEPIVLIEEVGVQLLLDGEEPDVDQG